MHRTKSIIVLVVITGAMFWFSSITSTSSVFSPPTQVAEASTERTDFITEKADWLATEILTFTTYGYTTLDGLADSAEEYGGKGYFDLPENFRVHIGEGIWLSPENVSTPSDKTDMGSVSCVEFLVVNEDGNVIGRIAVYKTQEELLAALPEGVS